ncbi:MAG: PEGA domain-containing protein [Deltaproteobacteria bacterium]|nr:PEGA domain-containing protein [Deltaproteobacteria bacterium]
MKLPPPATPPPDPNKPVDDSAAKAKVHFDNGNALFAEGNYAGALAEYTASYKLRPLPIVIKNIGLSQQRLFLYVEALESLQKYVDQAPDAADVAETKTIIVEIRNLLVEVRLALIPAAGVLIKVDGREIGKTPLPKSLLVAAGSRTFELSIDGYEAATQTLTVAAGTPLDLKAELKLIPKTGKIRITSPVLRATVSIDGKPVGIVPLEVELSGGGHTLEVIAPDHQPHRGELVVTVGQTRDVAIALDKIVVLKTANKPWYKKWYVVAPIGVVVVGAGVGTFIATRPEDPIAGTLAPGAGKIQ